MLYFSVTGDLYMFKLNIVFFALVLSFKAFALSEKIEFLNLDSNCTVRVVSQSPDVDPKGDVLFLTGFADRADNHGPLFNKIVESGFRVISFDYPSHGETDCSNLNFHNFTSLSQMAVSVLEHPNYKSKAPLYVMGWSTGGLLGYRMVQDGDLGFRDIKGLVLLAPGLSVSKLPGEFGKVTQRSLLLNPNPPHKGPIKPISPLLYPGFSVSLLKNSYVARNQPVPELPILMLLADDQADVYANTPKIKKWYKKIKSKKFMALQCVGAKHELDNEIEPVGTLVRDLIGNFISHSDQAPQANGYCSRL